MDNDPTTPVPLPVFATIRDAFQFVLNRRVRLLRALLVPAIVILFLEYYSQSADWATSTDDPDFGKRVFFGWIYWLIYTAPYILFAITCHRLALFGDPGVPKYGLLKWTQREWRYLGWAIVIMIIVGLCTMVINNLYVSKIVNDVGSGVSLESSESTWLMIYLAYIPILYIFSRLSVLYPAIAVEKPVTVKWAWWLTLHNGWRLTLVVGLLPWVLSFATELLLRENASLVEELIVVTIGLILLAVEVVALSFSYKHLTEQTTPSAFGT